MMNGQSQSSSAEELREEHNGGIASGESSARSSSSTVSSLMELGWTEDEHFTIERIQRTRKRLEDEIEVNSKRYTTCVSIHRYCVNAMNISLSFPDDCEPINTDRSRDKFYCRM